MAAIPEVPWLRARGSLVPEEAAVSLESASARYNDRYGSVKRRATEALHTQSQVVHTRGESTHIVRAGYPLVTVLESGLVA